MAKRVPPFVLMAPPTLDGCMTVDIDSSLKVCNAYLCRKKKQKQNKNAKMFKLMIFKNIINNFEFCLFFK